MGKRFKENIKRYGLTKDHQNCKFLIHRSSYLPEGGAQASPREHL